VRKILFACRLSACWRVRGRLPVRHYAASAAAGVHSAHQPLSQRHLCGRDRGERSAERREHQYLSGSRGHGEAIFVAEGQEVRKGRALLLIDDSIQRATVEQQHSSWQAALTVLDELRAQPRKETLDVAIAQVDAAQASLKTAQDELLKQQAAYDLNPKSISKDALDSAANAALVAKANLEVARRNYDLTKAGAWIYDITNQEEAGDRSRKGLFVVERAARQVHAGAPRDGVVMAVNVAPGSFVSTQGAYDQYTEGAPRYWRWEALPLAERSLLRRRNSGAAASDPAKIKGADVRARLQRRRFRSSTSECSRSCRRKSNLPTKRRNGWTSGYCP
jgi:multidrug efflux pump subunit AcrA (membrane-fusion protein)